MLRQISNVYLERAEWYRAEGEFKRSIDIMNQLKANFAITPLPSKPPSHYLYLVKVNTKLAEAYRGLGKPENSFMYLKETFKIFKQKILAGGMLEGE